MAQINYNKEQMDNFKKSLVDAKKRLMEGARQVIVDSLLNIQTTAKSPGYVPYKTGTLKRSITHDDPKVSDSMVVGIIGTNVEYARIQEYGGFAGRNHKAYIKPKLYMTRAVKETLPKINKRFAALKIIRGK